MTTVELTALSFSMITLMTSILWFHKPAIARPRQIHTRNGRTIEEIRQIARSSVCCLTSKLFNLESATNIDIIRADTSRPLRSLVLHTSGLRRPSIRHQRALELLRPIRPFHAP